MIKLRSLKLISLVVLGTTMAGLLMTGCKKEPTAPTGTEKSGELKPVTIKWYVDATPPADLKQVMDEVNKKYFKDINVTLDMEYLDWSVYDDKMKLKIASNEEFDLCFTSSWAANFFQNSAQGNFREVSDLVNRYGQNIKKQLPDVFWNATAIKGKNYGVPVYASTAVQKGIWIDKTYYDKYSSQFDFKSVKKPADLTPLFAMIKKDYPNVVPTDITGDGYTSYNMETGLIYDQPIGFDNPAAVSIKNGDNKVINYYEQPEVVEHFKLLRDWYNKGYIRSDAAAIIKNDHKPDTQAKKYAAGIPGAINPSAKGQVEGQTTKFPVEIVPLTDYYMQTASFFGQLTAISKTSKNPERAMMVLDKVYGDKALYNTLAYGIEGTHYTVNGNFMKQTDAGAQKFGAGIQWEFGNCYNAYLKEGQDADTWEKEIATMKTAKQSPYLGFVFDSEPVKKEHAAINAAIEEYTPILKTGSADVDKTLATLNDRLKKAGMDAYMAEVQKQLNEWLKNKK